MALAVHLLQVKPDQVKSSFTQRFAPAQQVGSRRAVGETREAKKGGFLE